jgi:hypothetical protein
MRASGKPAATASSELNANRRGRNSSKSAEGRSMRANARFVNLPLPGDCKEEGTSEHRGKRMTDINRRPPETEKEPANSTIFVPLETADKTRARLKKMYPGLTDEEIDHFV